MTQRAAPRRGVGGIDARMRMYASAEVLIVRGVSARRDARQAENREVRSLICLPPAPPVWLAGWLSESRRRFTL